MPHVIVKLYAGRSDQQKARLADAVSQAVAGALKLGEDSVSVSVEDVAPADWLETVYKPDILGEPEKLYKKPGYDPRG
jgi:4-oxalocrotonate tautomerase